MNRSSSGSNLFSSSIASVNDVEDDEAQHLQALDAAYAAHDRIREIAIQALELNELFASKLKLEESAAQQQERLRLEKAVADEAQKLLDLKAKSISVPKDPARSVIPPTLEPRIQEAESQLLTSTPIPEAPRYDRHDGYNASDRGANFGQAAPAKVVNGEKNTPVRTTSSTPVSAPTETDHKKPAFAAPITSLPAKTKQSPSSDQEVACLLPGTQRYLEIHQNLKKMRKWIDERKETDAALKRKSGDGRRLIRQCLGQLNDNKVENKAAIGKIHNVLLDALQFKSSPADPTLFLINPPSNVDGAPQLPCLFIYLINMLSKLAIRQFMEECAARPEQAEPIGVLIASTFAKPGFMWQGNSLIDIFMAKMRVVCPVLFGIRGSDRTAAGRALQGWRKEAGQEVIEQTHFSRMTGLGAGYASIALRDFSKTSMTNPWPPSLYWRSLASIISSPHPSGTQYLVVKALIENYEQRFLSFYGNAGRAALQAALVEFPKRDEYRTVSGQSLSVLADKLRKDIGLVLPPSR